MQTVRENDPTNDLVDKVKSRIIRIRRRRLIIIPVTKPSTAKSIEIPPPTASSARKTSLAAVTGVESGVGSALNRWRSALGAAAALEEDSAGSGATGGLGSDSGRSDGVDGEDGGGGLEDVGDGDLVAGDGECVCHK